MALGILSKMLFKALPTETPSGRLVSPDPRSGSHVIEPGSLTEQILRCLQDSGEATTVRVISDAIGKPSNQITLKLKSLSKEGLVEIRKNTIGSNQYRLTDQGKALI